MKSYVSYKEAKEAAETSMKDDAERIKAELKVREVNELTVEGHEVKLTPVPGRKTLDKVAMKKDGIPVEDYEKVGNPSERLTIT